MNDNEPHDHELGPPERALIDAALSAEAPPPRARERVRGAVLARVAAAAAGTTVAATTATKAAASGILTKALIVVGLTGLGVGAYVIGPSRAPQAPVAAPAEAPAPAVTDAPPPERAEPVAPPVASSVAPVASASAPAAKAPPKTSTFDDEVALLKEAQRQMQAGNPEQALKLLDRHEREHAGGALGEERKAARVLALCKAGRKTEARALAAQFLAERPGSPFAGRVRSACP